VVEQTRDLAQAANMLSAAGMLAAGVESSGGCYLIAYAGDQAVGVVGVESRVDAALIRCLSVIESMRRRGAGAALISAARTAAHTRGARTLYAVAPLNASVPGDALASRDVTGLGNAIVSDDMESSDAERYLERFGFAPVAAEEMLKALFGTFMADYLRQHPAELARLRTLSLDISDDGVILR